MGGPLKEKNQRFEWMPGRLQEETAGISRKALDTWQEITLGKRLGSEGSQAKQQS